MTDFEAQLTALKKPEPSARFVRCAKQRLFARMEFHAHETWFRAFVRRLSAALPSAAFVAAARLRLMERIAVTVQPRFGWAVFLKRALASTLVMALAVTSTLFYVDGRQVVNASEETYLQVLSGPVTVKRADALVWDTVTTLAAIGDGDLIKTGSGARAFLQFFDDTQARLDENTIVLVNQTGPSPAFARQGVFSLSLQEGRLWAQTLNVEDGHAGLTVMTRDAVARAVNSVFDVQASLTGPSAVRVFNRQAVVQDVSLPAGQKMIVGTGTPAPAPIADADRAEAWVSTNLEADHRHLTALREREFETLRQATGVLPGQVLYPVKLAKERLGLALSFGDSDFTAAQIDIANKRLNEAIVLLENGNQAKATEALMAYRQMTREIVEKSETAVTREEINQRIITKNQKALVAALPTDPPVRLVTEALNQTKEMIAENPLDRERVRLQNSIGRLGHIQALMTAGDFEAAKAALADHRVLDSTVLADAGEGAAGSHDVFADILSLRQQEAALLAEFSAFMGDQPHRDTQLLAMLEQASLAADETVAATIDFIAPFAPELVARATEPALAAAEPDSVQDFVDRLMVYKTHKGQQNQLARLLKEAPDHQYDAAFLTAVRDRLSGRTADLVNGYILAAERQDRVRTHKAVKQKIDRAKKLREQR